jgi:hypothetical protein
MAIRFNKTHKKDRRSNIGAAWSLDAEVSQQAKNF